MKTGYRLQVIGYRSAKSFRDVVVSMKRFLPPTTCNLQPKQSGFSLVELLVSMALFIVVLTISVGSLLVLINTNSKAQNMHMAVSNVQFALDSMTRVIRTGHAYYCHTDPNTNITSTSLATVNDCSNKGVYLSVINSATNTRVAYRYNNATQSIDRRLAGGSWVRLTDPNVAITDMHFSVSNTATKSLGNNNFQPNVTIFISGHVKGLGATTDTTFNLQTTVTRRTLDL